MALKLITLTLGATLLGCIYICTFRQPTEWLLWTTVLGSFAWLALASRVRI